ncbi:MAG: putative two-component histidine kinase sensor protein, partial [Rhodocyclales bacterium]|nr:putative two-component histidine kinase sensor protein [Rhodocyclales bacterium]
RLKQHGNEQEALTRELHHRAENMEAEIYARAQELQVRHTELQVLAAQLQAGNEELQSFAYSVSHDLRAPLRAIDGFSRLLASRAEARLDDEDQRLLSVIRTSSKTMGQLIDDLLQFSRMNRAEMHVGLIDMEEVVRTTWETTKDGFTGGIVFERLPMVLGDRALIQQVWVNLFSNAVKYSAKVASPSIVVKGEMMPTECVYHVHDNGVGFDMRYIDKLFGMFQRLHSADDFPGTGIGLAIVSRIVNRHGGRVWAEASPDEGAHFYFALPVTEERGRPKDTPR